jgi:hypothetical protein
MGFQNVFLERVRHCRLSAECLPEKQKKKNFTCTLKLAVNGS